MHSLNAHRRFAALVAIAAAGASIVAAAALIAAAAMIAAALIAVALIAAAIVAASIIGRTASRVCGKRALACRDYSSIQRFAVCARDLVRANLPSLLTARAFSVQEHAFW